MYETAQATRERILGRAREMFNERGIDNVGVRELARDLGLSPGNVSYHFPKKEDLVAGLLDELQAKNAQRPAISGQVSSLAALLDSFGTALTTQLEYRCLTQSIVHVVNTFPALQARYRRVEQARRSALAATVEHLRGIGVLDGPTDAAGIARLVATWSLIARFWLSERGVSYAGVSDARAIEHYVALVAHSLLPYACDSGSLAPYLAQVLADEAVGLG